MQDYPVSHDALAVPKIAIYVIMLGFDPWYRAWTTQEERLVLNAVLFPAGTAIPTTAAAREAALTAAHASAAAAPLSAARLPATRSRPVRPSGAAHRPSPTADRP